MSDWTPYDAQKPPVLGRLYWWRLPARAYGGLELRPEWTDVFGEMSCGFRNEPWPLFARWDGYRRSVPDGLEWREVEPADKTNAVRWPGVDLLPCPFCGASPRVSSHEASWAGGIFIGARGFQHNTWRIECTGCGLPSTHYSGNLAGLQVQWNRRIGQLELAIATAGRKEASQP